MNCFTVPSAAGALTDGGGSLRCGSGHCFDRAREGYVNLLPVSFKHSRAPGTTRPWWPPAGLSWRAGGTPPCGRLLCALAVQLAPQPAAVLDAGCGEGYYTQGVYEALAPGGKIPPHGGD